MDSIIMNDRLRSNLIVLLQQMEDDGLAPSDDFNFTIAYDKGQDKLYCWTTSMLTIWLNCSTGEFTYTTWHPEDDEEKTFDSIAELEEWRKPMREDSSDESELSDIDTCQIIQD